MTGRVWLHIGVMKSATSYLQGIFEINRAALAEQGFLWVGEELRYHALREVLGRGQPRNPSALATLSDQLVDHPGDVLLSNELLAALGRRHVARVADVFPGRPVQVLITARDLSRVIPSHWQTTIKNSRTWRWTEFASSVCADAVSEAVPGPEAAPNAWFWRRHDLAAIVSRWATVVPVEHITVVTVPPEITADDAIAARFGSVVGIDLGSFEEPDRSRNPSLGGHSVELARRLNEVMSGGTDDADHRFRRALGASLAAHADIEPRFGLDPQQHEWVRGRAEAMVEEIRASGARVVGNLSDLIPGPAPVLDAVDPGSTSDADLLAAATRGLTGLAAVFSEQRANLLDLQARLAIAER